MSIKTDYIDTESALKRLSGNAVLYKKLLRHYLDDSHINELCQAVEKGNTKEAIQIAHTLKGVSANLSLNNIRLLATDIEAKLKTGIDCNALLPELKTSFDKTKDAIEKYIG